MTRSPGGGAGSRGIAASRRRWTGRRAAPPAAAGPSRATRARPRPPRRTAARSPRTTVSTRTSRPVSASMSVSSPTSGRSSSRGSRISTARTWWWAAAPAMAGASRAARGSRRRGRRGRPVRRSTRRGGAHAPGGHTDRLAGAVCRRRRGRDARLARGESIAQRGERGRLIAGRQDRLGVEPGVPQQRESPEPATGRRQPPVLVAAERDHPKAVAPLRREVADARATPSATSALRRSAVPKVIDGETSRSSHAVSARSGTWTRTCGMVVRAVTFQSIRRTSSPGSYGRTWASSVPPPRSWARNSPGRSPRIRRPTVRSSARSSASGVGPGPGCAGRSAAESECRDRSCRSLRPEHARWSRDAASATATRPVEDHVGRDFLGEGREAGHDAVAEDIAGELGHVGRDDVAAAADDGQRAGGMDEVDRAARAGAERDVRLDLRQADDARVARGGGQRDGVVDDRAGRRRPQAVSAWRSARPSAVRIGRTSGAGRSERSTTSDSSPAVG